MTTPNEELITRLGVIANTEANELADALNEAAEALQSQQELLSSQAARIKELDGGVAHWKALREAAVNVANDRREERDTLRAQLAVIAATEPVGKVEIAHDMNDAFMRSLPIGTKLFTCPMPVQSAEHCLWARNGHEPCQHVKPSQDVTELVEALEKLARLGNGEHYGNSDGNMIAREALSKYKGAKQ